jgi:hypothetical protein
MLERFIEWEKFYKEVYRNYIWVILSIPNPNFYNKLASNHNMNLGYIYAERNDF